MLGLGLKSDTVRLVPYDKAWDTFFEETKAKLSPIFGTNLIEFEHIGSTSISVPGIVAKPILDVNITVRDISAIPVQAMEQRGYIYKGEFGIPGRFFFVKYIEGDIALHHVHCYPDGHQNHLDNITFRDYLRSHPESVLEYGELKQRLASVFPVNRANYTAAKSDFVRKVLALARTEAKADGE